MILRFVAVPSFSYLRSAAGVSFDIKKARRRPHNCCLFQEELQEPRGPGEEVQVVGRGRGREDHTGGAEGESEQRAAMLCNVTSIVCSVLESGKKKREKII